MSTITKINFEPLTDLFQNQMRSKKLADPTLADPFSVGKLIDGEWMGIDNSDQLVVAASRAAAGNAAAIPSWPVWDEAGRTDNQALAEKMKTVIWAGPIEAHTRIFLATTMAINRLVSVASIDIGGKIVLGLVDNGTFASPGSGLTVGFVTKTAAANGGKLRFKSAGVWF